MATPLPRECYDSDEEYLRSFWIISEFGISDPDDRLFFKHWFMGLHGDSKCPQEDREVAHLKALPESGIVVYRGYCQIHGSLRGMSWSPDRKCAELFALRADLFSVPRHGSKGQPVIATLKVRRDEIAAVLLDREVEYVIPEFSGTPTIEPFIKEDQRDGH